MRGNFFFWLRGGVNNLNIFLAFTNLFPLLQQKIQLPPLNNTATSLPKDSQGSNFIRKLSRREKKETKKQEKCINMFFLLQQKIQLPPLNNTLHITKIKLENCFKLIYIFFLYFSGILWNFFFTFY